MTSENPPQILSVLPPSVQNLSDLIDMCKSGKHYDNINNGMLKNIYAQMVDIDGMIGMENLKQSIFFHIIYYLLDLHGEDCLHTVIIGPPGSGKCLSKNTQIMMFDGTTKNVQDLQVSDAIMGDDSTMRNILSICEGYDDMYDVYPDYSNIEEDSYCVNKSHILSVISDETGNVEDICIEDLLLKSNDYQGYKTSINFQTGLNKTNIDPYILAYCMISHTIVSSPSGGEDRLMISIPDERVMKYFLDSMLIEYRCFPEDEDDYLLLDIKKHMNTSEILNNLTNYTWDTLKKILSGINDRFGVIVGEDSTIFSSNDDVFNIIKQICNILGIKYICEKNNIQCSLSDDIHDVNQYEIIMYDIFSHIPSLIHYHSSSEFVSPKKVPYSLNIVKKTGKHKYYGFEIDGNGRFVLGNYTVTHNTTVAKIIGEMYKNMGILSSDGIFKIAKREDLVAEYLGQTAIKTKKLLESCIGGVLFIDEVYALGPGGADKDSFSKESIDTLNAFLSEHNNNFCCIIAGYEEDVKNCFFKVNQGLERRFQWVHRIEDYSMSELGEMFLKLLNEINWKRDELLTLDVITNLLTSNKDMFKSFGGDIQNLITKCKMTHARRIISTVNPKKHVITCKDLLFAIELMRPNSLNRKDETYYDMYI